MSYSKSVMKFALACFLAAALNTCSSDGPLFLKLWAYVAVGQIGTTGNLVRIDPTDGSSTVIGPIGEPITGMAFSPSGVLYATNATNDGSDDMGRLFTIDTKTGAATEVDTLDDGTMTNHPAVADITFMGNTIYGFEGSNTPRCAGDILFVTVDPSTADVTCMSDTGFSSSAGNGIAANASGTLYAAPDGNLDGNGNLYTINPSTGASTVVAALTSTNSDHNMAALAFMGNQLLGLEIDDSGPAGPANLVSVDLETGAVTVIGAAPTGSDALAVGP